MDLEVIEIVTYICAILGGILLLLCIILAAFFIYGFCKKHFGCDPLLFESNNRYVIVPSENNAENGQIILRKYSSEGIISPFISQLFCLNQYLFQTSHNKRSFLQTAP